MCAPTDVDFQTWLEGIDDKSGVVNCKEGEGDESDDRAALVALYEATDGDNWKNKTNWLSDEPLGEWFGVETDANGRVTSLELDGNGLSGGLPSSLGDLTNLQELWLSGNEFSGALPSSLGDLTNLQTLLLNGNEFSGALPSSLGNLTRLQTLWLASNNFSGALPSWLGNLTNLESLVLANNNFSGALPSWLGNLTNLESLVLANNNFSGALPSWLGNLTNLCKSYGLAITSYRAALPASLVNLANLEVLDLRDTQLCAPTDAAFQAWLEGIDDKQGVVNCGDPNPDRARTGGAV